MSRMGDFIAFQAAVALLHDHHKEHILEDAYQQCLQAEADGTLHEHNFVQAIYEPFSADQVSCKIAEMLRPDDVHAGVDIIYQSLEGLYDACPENKGDWYFTGNYPTPGGNKVVNKAFMNYMEGRNVRGY